MAKKAPRMLYPTQAEADYISLLLKMVHNWQKTIKSYATRFKSVEYQLTRDKMLIMDSWAGDLDALFKQVGFDMQKVNPSPSEIKLALKKASDFNQDEFYKVVYAMMALPTIGIQNWKSALMDDYLSQNVSLVKGLTAEMQKKLEITIREGFKSGKSWETIQEELLNDGLTGGNKKGVLLNAEERAKLIAVDQIGKLNGELVKNSALSIGILGYTWETVRDIRVRDEHNDEQGRKYLFPEAQEQGVSLPAGYSKTQPKDGFPGWAIRCRCWARLDFNWILD